MAPELTNGLGSSLSHVVHMLLPSQFAINDHPKVLGSKGSLECVLTIKYFRNGSSLSTGLNDHDLRFLRIEQQPNFSKPT